jgi:hypothetical protein
MAGAAALVGLGLIPALQIAQGSAARSVANRRARQIEDIGGIEADEARREGRRRMGSARTTLARSGVDPGFGSALRVLSEVSTESELTALRRQFRFQTAAEDLKQQGKAAQFQSFGSAAGSLLGGTAKAKEAGLFDMSAAELFGRK